MARPPAGMVSDEVYALDVHRGHAWVSYMAYIRSHTAEQLARERSQPMRTRHQPYDERDSFLAAPWPATADEEYGLRRFAERGLLMVVIVCAVIVGATLVLAPALAWWQRVAEALAMATS